MKSILVTLEILTIIILLVAFTGCTNVSSIQTVSPTTEITTTPTLDNSNFWIVQVYNATSGKYERVVMTDAEHTKYRESSPVVTKSVTICDEWASCGFGFGNFNGEPQGVTPRCKELYNLRMRNDQSVMKCLANPYEASGDDAVIRLHCMQGVGTVEDCAKYGIKLDRDNGNVIN